MNAVLQDPPRLATLHRLLDEGRARWSPEYRDRLVSHLPMAQQALWALGADNAQLQRFTQAQLDHLEPLPWRWQAPAPHDDWRALRGRLEELPRLLAHFDAALAEDGLDATLADALPALLDGGGTMAFHALIRLGHAVQVDHAGETALALAYWAARHQSLHAPTLPPGDLDPIEWLHALRALPGQTPRAGLIADRMSAWAASAEFAALAARLRVTDAAQTLRQLAEWLAGAYAASGNFTLLHGLTASRAMRVLLPRLREPAAAVQAHAFDLAAALRASGWTGSPGPPCILQPQWAAYMAAACEQDDAHVVKLVHACVDWAGLYDGACTGPVQPSVWADAAARALAN